MRELENVNKSRRRFLILIVRHLRALLFIVIAWSAVFVLRAADTNQAAACEEVGRSLPV